MLFLIDRGDHFQAGYLIVKGSNAQLRAQGIEAFRKRLATLMPTLADRVDTVRSWAEVKLLTVRLNRMPHWYAPGLLCIGDAAHAMSPVGGVGINLAVQDAVAAARYLAAPLRRGETRVRDLARVQRRRWLPTVVTQSLQWLIHQTLLKRVLAGEIDLADSGMPPAPLRVVSTALPAARDSGIRDGDRGAPRARSLLRPPAVTRFTDPALRIRPAKTPA